MESVIESFRIEGRVIRITGSGAATIVEIFFPYTQEAISHIREGSFLAFENVRSIATKKRYSLFNVVSYDVFHSGLTDLDPTKVPFPETVIEVASRAYRELVEGNPGKISLAGIRVRCVPAGYEIVDDQKQSIKVSTEKPLIGTIVNRPRLAILDKMFNRGLSVENGAFKIGDYYLGNDSVQILLSPKPLIQQIIGVFASTGAGKSFLISNLIRGALDGGFRCIVFDTVPEFPALLMDVIHKYAIEKNDDYKTSLIFREKSDIVALKDPSALLERFTIPEPLRDKYRESLIDIFSARGYYDPVLKIMLPLLTSSEIVNLVNESMGRKRLPQAEIVAQTIEQDIEDRYPDAIFAGNVPNLDTYIKDITPIQVIFDLIEREKARIDNEKDITYRFYDAVYQLLHQKSRSRDRELSQYIAEIENRWVEPSQVIEPRELVTPLIDGDTRLHIIMSDVSDDTKHLISTAISNAFALQKKGNAENSLLFVIDEAHNFASLEASASSRSIERLAREGRKFNLGLCMASQRCTYLNTSIMAQLKSYFISNLRMKTDRDRIRSIFDINSEILDSSVNLSGRDWYLVSEVATGLKNSPMKIKVDDVISRIEETVG